MNRMCTCGHTYRIHGRPWIPDDNCRAYNHLDGPCGCEMFDASHEEDGKESAK